MNRAEATLLRRRLDAAAHSATSLLDALTAAAEVADDLAHAASPREVAEHMQCLREHVADVQRAATAAFNAAAVAVVAVGDVTMHGAS